MQFGDITNYSVILLSYYYEYIPFDGHIYFLYYHFRLYLFHRGVYAILRS